MPSPDDQRPRAASVGLSVWGTPWTTPAETAALNARSCSVATQTPASRLRVSEDHAAHLVHAAGCGTTLTLIAMPEDRRDSALSHTAREAVIAAITTDAPAPVEPGPIAAAVALRAVLPQTTALAIAVPLAGILASDATQLDHLAEAWGAGSRSALVEAALRLYLRLV